MADGEIMRLETATQGSIFKTLFRIALPVLLTSISQMAYNLTDMFWIGRVDLIGLSESAAVAGIGTAGYITWFAFGLILIGKIGTSVKVSHAIGAGETSAVDRFASNGLVLLTMLGLVFGVLVYVFALPILSVFNIQSPMVLTHALQYLKIVGGLFVVPFTINGFSAIYEGMGRTKVNFRILVVGLVMNIVLDPLFILVFKLGVEGAALATVLSQATTLLLYILLYHLSKKRRNWTFSRKHLQTGTIGEIMRVGLPAGFHSMLFTSISIYLARLVFVYGADVMTAQRVGSQIEQFTWMIGGGFQTALTVFVGQNYGARQFTRIRKGVFALSSMLLPYALIVSAALFFFGEALMRLFLDDPASIEHGVKYLRLMSYAQPFMMLEGIGAGFFNGIALTKIPSTTGIIGNVLRIPLAFLLTSSMAEIGIWWTLNISDFFKGAVLALLALWWLPRIDALVKKRDALEKAKSVVTNTV
jgi:putative MATE family efflux protein